ncbi:hypothetical protein BH10PLA1_BH10PLA1_00490 [soil metagenome]
MAIEWGYCVSCGDAERFKAAGWDYVEENIQTVLQGTLADNDWTGGKSLGQSVLPVPAGNCLLPGDLKITGPVVDLAKVKAYLTHAFARGGETGLKTMVFGSGGARTYPDGFDPAIAKKQILEFLTMAAPLAKQYGVTIVAEPLNRKESNILNSVGEAMEYVTAINHPNFKCLVDSYHFWLEDEPLSNLAAAMPSIKHVHLADKVGRTAPGESGQSDYKPFFKVLKQGGYSGRISVEASDTGKTHGKEKKILAYVKEQWNAA